MIIANIIWFSIVVVCVFAPCINMIWKMVSKNCLRSTPCVSSTSIMIKNHSYGCLGAKLGWDIIGDIRLYSVSNKHLFPVHIPSQCFVFEKNSCRETGNVKETGNEWENVVLTCCQIVIVVVFVHPVPRRRIEVVLAWQGVRIILGIYSNYRSLYLITPSTTTNGYPCQTE